MTPISTIITVLICALILLWSGFCIVRKIKKKKKCACCLNCDKCGGSRTIE